MTARETVATPGGRDRVGGVMAVATFSTPDRSLSQRMEALQRANDVRHDRAVLKRELKAGRVRLADLLVDPPEYLWTAKVFDLLLAAPKIGRVKANKILTGARISPSKTIGGLSDRQRRELAGMQRRRS